MATDHQTVDSLQSVDRSEAVGAARKEVVQGTGSVGWPVAGTWARNSLADGVVAAVVVAADGNSAGLIAAERRTDSVEHEPGSVVQTAAHSSGLATAVESTAPQPRSASSGCTLVVCGTGLGHGPGSG